MDEEKKTRVIKQNERQVQNVRTSVKKGKHVPANVRLTSELPEHGKGNILKRKGLEKEVGTVAAVVWETTKLRFPPQNPYKCIPILHQ